MAMKKIPRREGKEEDSRDICRAKKSSRTRKDEALKEYAAKKKSTISRVLFCSNVERKFMLLPEVLWQN